MTLSCAMLCYNVIIFYHIYTSGALDFSVPITTYFMSGAQALMLSLITLISILLSLLVFCTTNATTLLLIIDRLLNRCYSTIIKAQIDRSKSLEDLLVHLRSKHQL